MKKIANLSSAKTNYTGITLIALVITIIVLLILAGITIATLTGENGILHKATQAEEKTEQSQAKEKLELTLLDLQTEKSTNSNYNENEFIDDALLSADMQVDEDIITVDNYQFQIDRTVPKIVNELGKATEQTLLMPVIRKIYAEEGHTQIHVKIELKNIEGTTLTYIIQKEGELVEKERIENQTEFEHTFKNLELNTKYKITIEATNEYGTRTRNITISTKKPSIQLSDTSLRLKIDETKLLTYTIIPETTNKNIKWTSSNSNVVTVDENGLLTAIKEGKATITALSEDDSLESAICMIEVVKTVYLIQDGQLNQNILGSWNPFFLNKTDSFVTYPKNGISIQCSHANNRVGIYSTNKIDVTDINSITTNISLRNNYFNATTITSSLYIGLCSTIDNTVTNFERYVSKSTKANSTQNYELNLDTKDLQGEYYLKIVATHGNEYHAYSVFATIFNMVAWK
ncbi:MAG: hypothetical protein HFJ34_04120 [Clostridia bacterium]|nr:hypothetical protein [Clostridia bacterium]